MGWRVDMKDEDKTREQLIRELAELRQQIETIPLILNHTIEATTDFVGIIDAEGNTIYLNQAGRKALGYGDDEDLSKVKVTEYSTEESIPALMNEALPAAIKCGIWEGENVLVTKDGSKELVVSQKIISHKDDKGEIEYFSAIIRDITETKQANDELRESEERYRTLIENAPLCIHEIDLNGRLTSMNPVGLEMIGAAEEQDICGLVFCDYASDNDRGHLEKLMAEAFQGKTSIFEFSSSNVPPQVFRSSFVPIRDKEGAIVKLMGMTEEITEHKQLERQLRQAQKMEAIGILTGGIAHECNNLLSPILGYTEILMRDKAEYDTGRDYLEQIQIAGNRAKSLVQQMLAYGRRSISQREPVELETLVEETLKLIKNTIPPNISIKKEIEVDLPPILGMPNEVHQVLLNLCINASHAMKNGGEITIRLKKEGFRKFTNSEGKTREGHFIGLVVQDTGSGMDQDTLDRIFDPFFTKKGVGQGSGLGLSVVQGIVEQHQGHIEVDSKVGEGSTFHVYFPTAQEEVKPTVVKTETISQGNERILLIDDEPMIINLTKMMLEKLGYKVICFLDCVEAIKRFTDCPQDIDLVITDYGMRMMNGKQLAEKLKDIRPDIPIIMFTGYGDLLAKDDLGTWGMDDLLVKPIKLKELSEAVRGVLGKRLSKE